ncbi:hypothetical protein DIPPA_31997 [Diplonema papillatum]|nr:hypothetical protein DIPPA_31997 [Diplonema papillatum]
MPCGKQKLQKQEAIIDKVIDDSAANTGKEYAQEKRLHSILSDLVCEVANEEPDDVVDFMVKALRKRKDTDEGTQAEADKKDRCPKEISKRPLSVVVFGASGDLAKKMTFPALFALHAKGFLPEDVNIVGYARSEMSAGDIRERVESLLDGDLGEGAVDRFFKRVSYVRGAYDKLDDFKKLNGALKEKEGETEGNRLFYLAVPPTQFVNVSKGIKSSCMSQDPGFTRVIIEKPFGNDTESSRKLTEELDGIFEDKHVFRIDHFLGKEMVRNLLTLRFANKIFTSVWDNACIDNVQVTLHEDFGTEGRGGYYDPQGNVRDVLQNHILSVLAVIAMEKPRSLDAAHIRNEKVELLRNVVPAEASKTVIGQYTRSADGKQPGYTDDETVPDDSKTPTFVQTILSIENDRWKGVPFILKAGKAVEKTECVVRLQFKPELHPFGDAAHRNELVIRLQPDEVAYLKFNSKNPGMSSDVHTTELDLTYNKRYQVKVPDAYEVLIFDAILGKRDNFVSPAEVDAEWQIFTPLLHKIDNNELELHKYPFGSRGPPEADEMKKQYYKPAQYDWSSPVPPARQAKNS